MTKEKAGTYDIEDKVLVMYKQYIEEQAKCFTTASRDGLRNLYDMSLRIKGSSLDEVRDKVDKGRQASSRKLIGYCLSGQVDEVAVLSFFLMHTPVWANNYDGLTFATDIAQSEQVPSEVSWRNNMLTLSYGVKNARWITLNRDIDFGPALVVIDLDTCKYKGAHYVNGMSVKGHRNWRIKCKQHNMWMNIPKLLPRKS
jgi:hypothetical protein